MCEERCNHNGGRWIGAGHVCRCIRKPGHSERHGCECGAMWEDDRGLRATAPRQAGKTEALRRVQEWYEERRD